jgi:hypothetical protein
MFHSKVIVKALALAQDEDVSDDFRADYKGDWVRCQKVFRC